MLFLFFEDMKKVKFVIYYYRFKYGDNVILTQDLRGVVQRVAAHLGKTVNEEQMVRVLDHLSFKKLAEAEAASIDKTRETGLLNEGGSFFRKGSSFSFARFRWMIQRILFRR